MRFRQESRISCPSAVRDKSRLLFATGILGELLEGPLQNLAVLSHSEVPPGVRVLSLGIVQ